MLSRLIFGLALGLLMYMPRPRGPESGPPPTLPPGAEDLPQPDELPGEPGGELPDIAPIPLPDPGRRRPFPGHTPSVPPTPPPGYDGDWPPAGERPDVPPTPPPGHEGPWPGDRPSILERLRDLVQDLRLFDRDHGTRVYLADAKAGAEVANAAASAREA